MIARDIAHFYVRVCDAGGVHGHDDVAKQRQRRTQSETIAVDSADDRLFQLDQAEDDALHLDILAIEQAGIVDAPLHVRNVAAGREHVAAAGQHHHVTVMVDLHVVKDPRQLVVQSHLHRVHRRVVQRQRQHAPAPLGTDETIGAVIYRRRVGAHAIGNGSMVGPWCIRRFPIAHAAILWRPQLFSMPKILSTGESPCQSCPQQAWQRGEA
jgi:hypothetical protein